MHGDMVEEDLICRYIPPDEYLPGEIHLINRAKGWEP